uniref:Potassium/proton antiporter CemA n=1 Tax=Prasiolopsis wulf-kochii TaxID=3239232 RepID=A0A097KJU4_9CHLO|nr:chloroplast enveloppe membrane protein [Prasiolopsis sp. SAG 84.81]
MVKKVVEQTGLIPRSIIRTFNRFKKQLFPEAEKLIIQEFRISRYQFLVSIKCLANLIFVPLIVNFFLKNFLLIPITENFWNNQQSDIFLNSYQQDQAFNELKKFQEKLYFDYLLTSLNNVQEKSFLLEKNLSEATLTKQSSFGFSVETKIFAERNPKKAKFVKRAKQGPFRLNQASLAKQPSYGPLWLICWKNKNGFSYSCEPELEQLQKKQSFFSSPSEARLHFCFAGRTKNSVFFEAALLSQVQKTCKNSLPLRATEKKLSFYLKGNYTVEQEKSLQLSLNSYDLIPNRNLKIQNDTIKKLMKEKILELAIYHNHQSILAITNLIGDFITFIVFGVLIIYIKPQISILKSFLTESIYSLNDTKKSFLLILGTDLLVGFHSPRGWEICLELILRYFGLPENKDFVFLFVASFPVLLDTVFKYWIFRYLNKISPSTVATYHSMIE